MIKNVTTHCLFSINLPNVGPGLEKIPGKSGMAKLVLVVISISFSKSYYT